MSGTSQSRVNRMIFGGLGGYDLWKRLPILGGTFGAGSEQYHSNCMSGDFLTPLFGGPLSPLLASLALRMPSPTPATLLAFIG